MHLGRRLSTGVAEDPPARASRPDEPSELRADPLTTPDQRAAEIVAAAARRELAAER